jgi:2-methylisocitrate lyase-like PEP mutase family enzyme
MTARSDAFLALHHGDGPLLMPNAWDLGSARILAHLGFTALATTSSGFALTQGRLDGGVTRQEVLEHCAAMASATDLPLNGDLEDGFGETPAEVAETMRLCVEAGLAGASVEDFTRDRSRPIYDVEQAAERVAAAVEGAAAAGGLVVVARAENLIKGVDDLPDTIRRLQRYQEAGADVLFAPGLAAAEDIRAVVSSIDRPLNVLVRATSPSIAELAELGVARVSVGGSLAWVALDAVVTAARELKEQGTCSAFTRVPDGVALAREALPPS